MSDPRLLSDDELAAIRHWRKEGTGFKPVLAVLDAILARNPEPWEPSDADIDAYCEAFRSGPTAAAGCIKTYRAAGWDIVPRRIGEQP